MNRKVADTALAMRERNVFFRGMTAWVSARCRLRSRHLELLQ
jgi:hypothetical protein